jgi:hypothetical protein
MATPEELAQLPPQHWQDQPRMQRWATSLRRAGRWEFWPSWLVYIPVVLWILLLGLRHRRLTAFSACNPMMGHASGLCGESKARILTPLTENFPEAVPAWRLLSYGAEGFDPAVAKASAQDLGGYPLVIKPNQGQRGRAVAVVRSDADLTEYLSAVPPGPESQVLLQRFAAGQEFGVLIYKDPDTHKARILSINEKQFPIVIGDGERSLAELVEADARGALIAPTLWKERSELMQSIPAKAETVQLVEIGAHCRGTTFLDARHLITPELEAWAERVFEAMPGFNIGRADLRCASADDLARGVGLQVLEVNGVTSEPAHIYHPGARLIDGYRALFQHWRLCFALGAQEIKRDAEVTSAWGLLRLFRQDLARGKQWAALNDINLDSLE